MKLCSLLFPFFYLITPNSFLKDSLEPSLKNDLIIQNLFLPRFGSFLNNVKKVTAKYLLRHVKTNSKNSSFTLLKGNHIVLL